MPTGDICHIELATTDLVSSRDFYHEIFGWEFDEVPGMDGYALFRTPGGLGGGFSAVPGGDAPAESGPILHIEVNDIPGVLDAIVKRGGRVLHAKTKISDEFGYYALFLDNVGNRLGIWSSQ